MLNCKKYDCKYCIKDGGKDVKPSKANTTCDYIGFTGKMRGVYGEAAKDCPKYEKHDGKSRRQKNNMFINPEQYINYKEFNKRKYERLYEQEI